MCKKSIAEKVIPTKVTSSSDLESVTNTWENGLVYLSLGANRYSSPGATSLF